jgi:hypothetical protein
MHQNALFNQKIRIALKYLPFSGVQTHPFSELELINISFCDFEEAAGPYFGSNLVKYLNLVQ